MSLYLVLWAVVLLPAVAAVASFAAETGRRAAQICMGGSVVALIGAAFLLGNRLLHPDPPIWESFITFWTMHAANSGVAGSAFPEDFHPQLSVRADPLSLSLVVAVLVAVIAVQWHAQSSGRGDPSYRRLFWLTSALGTAMAALVCSSDLFTEVTMWGGSAAAIYLLSIHRRNDAATVGAGRRALTLLRCGDILLVAAVLVNAAKLGQFASAQQVPSGQDISDPMGFSVLANVWGQGALGLITGVGPRTLLVISLLLIAAVALRAMQFPLHSWSDEGMVAPASATALLGAVGACSAVLLLRAYPLFLHSPHSLTILATWGGVGVLAASVMALCQTDMRRVVLSVTAGQLGLALVAAGAGGYSVAAHQLFCLIPLSALGMLAVTTLRRGYRSSDINAVGGTWSRMPVTTGALGLWAALVVGAGLAPYGALSTLVRNSTPIAGHMAPAPRALLIVAVVLGALLLGLAALRLTLRVATGDPPRRRGFNLERIGDSDRPPRRVLLLLSAGALIQVAVGIPSLWRFTYSHVVFYGGQRQDLTAPDSAVALSIGLAIVASAAAVAWFRAGAQPRRMSLLPPLRSASSVAAHGFGVTPALARVWDRPTRLVGSLVASSDREILTALNDAVGEAVSMLARTLARPLWRRSPVGLGIAVGSAMTLALLGMLAVTGHWGGRS